MGFDVEAFLRCFVLPLVTGGELHIGPPIGADDLSVLSRPEALPDDLLVEVLAARQARAAEVWLYPVQTPWDVTAARLTAGLHNLLFFSHPDATRWTARESRLARLEALTRRALALDPPPTEPEMVARHTLLANLPRIKRTDVQLETWVMAYSFRGMLPPTRLRRWPGLRRVRERRTAVEVFSPEELKERQLPLLAQLLRASPLTDLFLPHRLTPPFSLLELAPYLRSQLLARLVCQRYLELGLDRVGPALARSFWALVDSPHSPAQRSAIRLASGLIVHLHAASCLTGDLLSGDATRSARGVTTAVNETLQAVLVACAACGLVPGPGVLGSREVSQRMGRLIAASSELLGNGANERAARLRAALS